MAALVELRKVTAGYAGRASQDIDLTINVGERVAVMGRSGAGKSTLLNLLYDRLLQSRRIDPQAAAWSKTLSIFHDVYRVGYDRHPTWYDLRHLVSPTRRNVANPRRTRSGRAHQ